MTLTADIFKQLEVYYDADNIYYQTISAVLEATRRIDASQRLQLILAQPKTELIVNFPVRMDDGSFRLFKGYRVQHNNILGPYKGGMRYHHGVGLDHIKSLAVLMTMKCALVRLPLGGAKGGLNVQPYDLSPDELMRMTRRFVSALGENIGPEHDIPAPDVGTNAQIMAWMADTYMNLQGQDGRFEGLGAVTGKPIDFGGSHGREKATGQGLVYVLEELLPAMGFNLSRLTYSLIGFGNVGSWTARLLNRLGATCKAVLDHTGAIINDTGLDVEALAEHVNQHRGVGGFMGGDAIGEETFYKTPIDLFIPAALEQMVDLQQAQWLSCKVIAEAANAPLTPVAQRYLEEQGVEILPAILCNCGGVTVSYFEWQQNRRSETWDAEVVDARLKRIMCDAAGRVKAAASNYDCNNQTAAYCVALGHLQNIYNLRGIFP